MTNKKRSKFSRNSRFLYVLAVLFLLIATVLVIKKPWQQKTSDNNQSSQIDGINFDPPTEHDKRQVEENKERIANEPNSPSPSTDPSTGKKNVSPIITYAGVYGENIEVGAYIPNIIESNGTCTLTLLKSGVSKTVTVQAITNANSTDCPAMSVAKSQLSNGTWLAKVAYNSPTSQGVSETREIEVK